MSAEPVKTDKKLGLCLGGGGGLGFLHLGLFEALGELGLRPAVIAGTSSGAVMGAFYASGKSPAEIRKVLEKFRWTRIIAPVILHSRGISSTKRMQSFYREHLGKGNIEDLPVRLKIASVNLIDGTLVGFESGSLAKCLAASSAVPGVFEPVKIGDGIYYDAGGICNLPLELFAGEGVETIIAGNTIGKNGLMKKPRTVQETFYQAYLIRCMHFSLAKLGPSGWIGKKDERVVHIDYPSHGASPRRIGEVAGMIEDTRALSLEILGRELYGEGQKSAISRR